MRVKRLEIQGFKSFKDKTVVHFDHSITGIVGPNGCGKSNIVDAFFWVMGEQSYKHMRGSSSDDLIFNGSSKYSPLGMAEATLVLETDVPDSANAPDGATIQDVPLHLRSKEVSVTRRVYRSGEGEYFINGVSARLKDIQELFMDTGVGAKGYSVIEQGQIGKIVNAKPEERRLLIEEAAGIAKYKARKKESLRKMEATEANLSRLRDVIQEIERSLESLERQAQKARLYNKYKDELLDKEMTWGRRKAKVLREKLETLKADRERMEQELLALRSELQTTENSIEVDRALQLTDTKQAEDLQQQIQTLSGELTRQQSALDLSRRRQGDLTSQVESLTSEQQELEQSLATDRESLSNREEQLREAEAALGAASQNAQAKDDEVRVLRQQTEETRRSLESAKKEMLTAVAQSSDLTSRAAALASRMDSAREQAERLAQQVRVFEEKVESARAEAERAAVSAAETKEKLEGLRTELREQNARVQEGERNLSKAESEKSAADRALTQLRSRLQSLEELAAAHEGFADGPKAALDWTRTSGLEGRVRPVADLLDVPEGYDTALEGWLEGRLESLITEDADVAHRMLEEIRSNSQGRASVHLADALPAHDPSRANDIQTLLASAGFDPVKPLSEIVTVSSDVTGFHREIASRMIENVFVVRSMAPVGAFAAKGGVQRLSELGGWSLVSLEGAALDCSGVLRGGSLDSNRSATILVRKRTISELQGQVTDAEQVLQERERLLDEVRILLEEGRERKQNIQTELQGLEVQSAALDRDVHQMNRVLRDAESQLEVAQADATSMREEAERARQQREDAEGGLVDLQQRRTDLETRIAEGEVVLGEREAALHSQESELQGMRVEEALLRERATSFKRELDGSRSVIADRERRLADVQRVLERASREREQFTGGDTDIEEKIQELIRALGENKDQLSQVKDRLEQTGAKLNYALSRIKELHSTGDAKTSETTQLALETEKLSGELAHLVQNLEEKYGPGCLERPVTSPIQEEMNAPIVTTEMTAEEEQALGEQVERLRERIRRLGEVNVMAIEEFEALKKRYDHLVGEKADLERSMDNLREAIEHINKTSEDRFRKAFDAIAERFEKLFPIIFGGGQAKLSLVYPEGSTEILDAGVDILAQPPGKKVTNIGLLSGGEKALTAVSLIFAIFMVKPSPFCILDEVDAPLDDANIGKFNGLLREMSAKSQFILITHNKRTMELNDTLYGVTMEEPGVSRMVSIEMR